MGVVRREQKEKSKRKRDLLLTCHSFLYQGDSWEPLQVSAEFLKKLFSFLRVRPEYLDILFLFGAKAGAVEQSFSSFFSHCRPLSTGSCSYGEHLRSAPRWEDRWANWTAKTLDII